MRKIKREKYRIVNDNTLNTRCYFNINNIEFWYFKNKKAFYAICLCVLFCLVSSFCLFYPNVNQINEDHQKEIIELNRTIDSLECVQNNHNLHTLIGKYSITKDVTPICKDTLWHFIVECGAWYPEVVIAQIEQESGLGKSDLAKKANNLCGMKKVVRRKTTQRKNTDVSGFGVYDNWNLSVIDRMLYDYHVYGYKKPSKDVYIANLASYGADENYIQKIRNRAAIYEKEYKNN